MRPTFDDSSISIKEVLKTLIYKDLTRKTWFFDDWSWLNHNNLGLALSMALKICRNLENSLKVKVRKFQGHIAAFREIIRQKLEGELFCSPLS